MRNLARGKPEAAALRGPLQGDGLSKTFQCQIHRLGALQNGLDDVRSQKGEPEQSHHILPMHPLLCGRCCIIPNPNKLSTVMCMLRKFSLTPAYPNSSFDLKCRTLSVLPPSEFPTAELAVSGRRGF